MTIVVTGGGSGGHITPILAVARELKQLRPDVRIVYIGQTGDGLADVPARDPNIDAVHSVAAGKFRRYHSEGWKQWLDLKTMALNVRDVSRVLRGIVESWLLLRRIRPDIIFVKGGFVGVPVGIAAHWLRIPFVTHDSDAIPGLANRIIARWASKHTVAMPAELYHYPQADTITVGVPVVADYKPVDAAAQQQFRHEIGLPSDAQLLFIIGGGLGAQRINNAMVKIVPALLESFPKLHVVHGVGRAHEATVQQQYQQALTTVEQGRVRVAGFLHDVYRYSGASDVIITRAGATNLAEFAVQGKACIVIPSPFLTGGHQLKNAAFLSDQGVAEVVTETDLESNPSQLQGLVAQLLSDPAKRAVLGERFTAFGHPTAAHDLAMVLLTVAQEAQK